MTYMLITTPDDFLSTLITGCETGLILAGSLLAIYCLWSGIIEIMRASGLSEKIAKLLSPIIKRLFPHESSETREYVSLNIATNMLGAGGAATPLGIKAITSMYRGDKKATFSMVLFTVINTTSIQLIPSTVMGIMTTFGASNASNIILPSLIVSTTTTILAVALVYLLQKRK